jgi:hypothetical protein
MKKISIQDFLAIVRADIDEDCKKYMRRGQIMMSLLSHFNYGVIYNLVTFHPEAAKIDPFYKDSNIPAFLAYLADFVECS